MDTGSPDTLSAASALDSDDKNVVDSKNENVGSDWRMAVNEYWRHGAAWSGWARLVSSGIKWQSKLGGSGVGAGGVECRVKVESVLCAGGS